MNSNKNHSHIKQACALPDPYPTPQVVLPNNYYAMLLLEDYAGVYSELTAINQYFYHHLAFNDDYEELASLEKCISIIEMHHLALIGKTIKLLGATPKLRTTSNNHFSYWKSNYVYYGTDVCDMLAADIAAEKSAIIQYRRHQQIIDDPNIQELLERIIKDEKHHLNLFQDAAFTYCPGLIKP